MIPTLLISAAIGFAILLLGWTSRRFTAKSSRPTWRRVGLGASIILALAGLPFVGLSAYLTFFLAIGQPGPDDRMLATGVRYRREVLVEPRRVVVHVLEVDLARGVQIVASDPFDSLKNEADTATRAIDALNADAVINANFFYPFVESDPLNYAPHAGDLVQSLGLAIGQGRRYGQVEGDWVCFWSEPGGRVGFGEPPSEADAAVSGIGWLVKNGENVIKDPEKPYPRTVVGLDSGRKRLWLVVVDGKQPRYSEGLTLKETADLLIRLGATDAIQLDGGGSSILAARDDRGRPVLLSRPCHTKIPGRQRPVANFLGLVFAR